MWQRKYQDDSDDHRKTTNCRERRPALPPAFLAEESFGAQSQGSNGIIINRFSQVIAGSGLQRYRTDAGDHALRGHRARGLPSAALSAQFAEKSPALYDQPVETFNDRP
jgi:hypothetical protein